MQTKQLPLTELERIVQRCEAALLAGTSSHQDMVALVDAERELRRRERERANASAHETRAAHMRRTVQLASGVSSFEY